MFNCLRRRCVESLLTILSTKINKQYASHILDYVFILFLQKQINQDPIPLLLSHIICLPDTYNIGFCYF